MTYIKNDRAVCKFQNGTTTITLGSNISPFVTSSSTNGFYSTALYHTGGTSAVDITCLLTNDTDSNTPIGYVAPTGTRIGSVMAFKMSQNALPVAFLTTAQDNLSFDSRVLDTGDNVRTDKLDIIVYSCRE
jgi:hypothetical protein